jgi:probable F420-dependent oxidoreductase
MALMAAGKIRVTAAHQHYTLWTGGDFPVSEIALDAALPMDDLRGAGVSAHAAEDLGFAALWANETKHNPFITLALAAGATSRILLGTSVAIAFPRSPTVMAHMAWDLAALTAGRFILGLGTQVKAHLERRFGVPWEPAAPKLREYIEAIRAVWRSWQDDAPLRVEGRYYRLSLMTPFFNPGPIAHPAIPVYIAGVNPLLCRLAGEVAEGFHVHPFHTVPYVVSVVRPNVDLGLRARARPAGAVRLYAPVFVAPGETAGARREERDRARAQIAFYASTPSYQIVLRTHGWDEVAGRLQRLAAQRKWDELAAQVPDEMLDAVVVSGSWEDVGRQLKRRYAGVLDRVACYRPFTQSELPQWRRLVAAFHGG